MCIRDREYVAKPPPNRVWPDSITWEPNKIWIWDSRNFTRAKRHVVVILDVVSRKWIQHIVTPEFTMTQSQLVFMRALEAEGLANIDDITDAGPDGDLADREPVLLAWSDIHSGSGADRCFRRCDGVGSIGTGVRSSLLLVRPGRPADLLPVDRCGERNHAGVTRLLRTR